jgi:telomere length regulation protein
MYNSDANIFSIICESCIFLFIRTHQALELHQEHHRQHLKQMEDLRPLQTRRIKEKVLVTTSVNIKDHKSLLEALRNEPDLAAFQAAIRYIQNDQDLNIRIPSSKVTPILQILVQDVIPNYWEQLISDRSLQTLLNQTISCLRTLPALGAIIARLRALTKSQESNYFIQTQAACLVQLSERIFTKDLVSQVWKDIDECNSSKTQKTLFWKEFIVIVAGGKVISTVAEVQVNLNKSSSEKHESWLANGSQYAEWLADTFYSVPPEKSAQLLAKSLSLGYTGKLQVSVTFAMPNFLRCYRQPTS